MDDYGIFGENISNGRYNRAPSAIPKTIAQLIKENNLSYPFVVQKIGVVNTYSGVVLPVYTLVTIMKKAPSTYAAPHEDVYVGYVERIGYSILDMPVWMLVEKSGDNVLSLCAYKKFRESNRRKR